MSDIKYEILSQEEFEGDQGSQLQPLGGSLDNGRDDELGLGDWTYQFEIKVDFNGESKNFTIAFQPEERTDNIKAYSGYDLAPAGMYGYDTDESSALEVFCDYDTQVIDELHDIAKQAAKETLERLLDEGVSMRPSGP